MIETITKTQLAILETKQVRAKELYRQLDVLQRETEQLVGLRAAAERPLSEEYAAENIFTYLVGEYSPEDLLSVLDIQVSA